MKDDRKPVNKHKKRYSFLEKAFYILKDFCSSIFGSPNKNITDGVVEYLNQDIIFVRIYGNKNIFIPKFFKNNALNGDIVKVKLLNKKNKYGEQCGKIVSIIKRKNVFFVGSIQRKNNYFFLNVKDKKIYYQIRLIENEKNIAGYRAKVKIIKYPSEKDKFFLCEVIDVFGQIGEHNAEINTIIAEYNLNNVFDKCIIEEVNKIKIDIEKELANRKDYRDVFTCTIDPENAKDFDDALSIKILPNGNYEVGIHIADVSYFVREKTLLDREAYKRNTSVYLIDRVIPMLPDRLCNYLCSLVPNEDRLTMSIIVEIDKNCKIYNEWIGETIINSNKRMTYEEAQKYIEDKNSEYHEIINKLFEISSNLRYERIKNGAINFDFEDINFDIDCDNNLVMNVTKCKESHNLVEEFMLLANRRVAEYVFNITNNNENKKPIFIYRVHDYPEKTKFYEFIKQIKNFGIEFSDSIDDFAENVNKMLLDVSNRPDKNILSTLAIRTMQKAEYTTDARGHYGLAFKHYTHFTSPIRRYVDVTVHRLLKKYINSNFIYADEYYEKLCKYANEKESIAVDAERESIKFKCVEMLKNRIGNNEYFSGTISGLTDFGMFVELNDYKCDGLIRFDDYKRDYFVLDRINSKIFDKYTGNIFEIGDQINVVIKNCDVENRLIDLDFY